MNMRAATFFLGALFFWANGCGGDTSLEAPDAATSTERITDEASASSQALNDDMELTALPEASFDVILGTGRETYVPIVNGETMYLELGNQGLQHVLVSIRLPGLPQDRYLVDFRLVRNDGVAVSEPARVRLPFNMMPDGSGVELLGYTLVVAEPSLGVGHDGVLRVTVEGPDEEVAADERNVHVEWAPVDWNPDA